MSYFPNKREHFRLWFCGLTIFFTFLSQISAQAQATDGPAELPRVQVEVSLKNQPGSVKLVKKGDDLQDRKSTRLNSSHRL